MDRTDLLVIGAGPYAYAAAAFARENGVDVRVVGRPMAFWRDQMPAGMFLRSGSDWHLDAAGEHTFEAYFEDRGLRRADLDPIPIAVFLDYTEWFREGKALEVDERFVAGLSRPDGTFVATMEDGSTITADKVLAAPGIRHFANLPTWYDAIPPERRAHTSDLVSFDDLAGARVVVIVGGRQSAYEWAALLCDHGAERVDVVHRHATPTFARVSWAFVDPHIEQTLAHRGWWRRLPSERTAVDRGEVLAGGTAHAGTLAGAADACRHRDQPSGMRGHRRGGRRQRRDADALRRADPDCRLRRVRIGLQGRPRPRPLPRPGPGPTCP